MSIFLVCPVGTEPFTYVGEDMAGIMKKNEAGIVVEQAEIVAVRAVT
nr:hypothetical protein [Lacrimispora sp.]